MEEFLSDIEKEKLMIFSRDSVLKEALRKVFLKRIFSDGVLRPGVACNPYENFALNIYKDATAGDMYSDEELGHLTKIRRFAIELLQRGFTDLDTYKIIKPEERKEKNKGR